MPEHRCRWVVFSALLLVIEIINKIMYPLIESMH